MEKILGVIGDWLGENWGWIALAGRGVELGMWTRLRTGDSGEKFALRAVEVLPSRVSPKDGKIQEGKRWNKMVNEGAPWNRKEKDGMRMEY